MAHESQQDGQAAVTPMTTTTQSSPSKTYPRPYDRIAAAQRHLANQPNNIAARGELAEAYLAAGCPELAAEQLRAIQQAHPGLPNLHRALQQLTALPPSIVPRPALQAQLEDNLRLCRQRWPERDSLWASIQLPAHLEVFRCTDGNLQARLLRDSSEPIWFPFADHRAAAAATQLPPRARHSLHDGYLVCSLALGEPVLWLFNTTRDGLNGLEQTIILLEPDLENLAINLAIRPWAELLQAPRVRLFAGPDYRRQLLVAIKLDHHLPIPSFAVKLTAWPHHQPLDAPNLLQTMMRARQEVTQDLLQQVNALYESRDLAYWAARFAQAGTNGHPPLRILGVTSLMTTVLQYSMRDWLAAFDDLHCQTLLLAERTRHCTLTPAAYLETILQFQPDLFVIHDHLRQEYDKWFPPNLPMLSWIQDRMPQLFAAGVGTKIGPLDFVTGMGKKECVVRCGYPFEHFLPMPQLTSQKTYYRLPPGQRVPDRYVCDVSYVSHAGMTVQQLIDQAVNCADDPRARRLLADVADDLVQRCRRGNPLFTRREMADLLAEHERRLGGRLDSAQGRDGALEFLLLKFNSPLLRQTVAGWLLDAGLNLHLYGKGWQENPAFARFARGVAANGDELRCIFQGSKINLQIQPFGAIHSRLLDGLASGGFFLIFACPLDQIGRPLQQLHRHVQQHGITDYRDLLTSPDPQVQPWIDQVQRCLRLPRDDPQFNILVNIRFAADAGFLDSADLAIPGYDTVAFASRQELLEKVQHFLAHEQERRALAERMREAVTQAFSYRCGTERMLAFITQRLQQGSPAAAGGD